MFLQLSFYMCDLTLRSIAKYEKRSKGELQKHVRKKSQIAGHSPTSIAMWHRDNVSNGNSAAGSQKLKEKKNWSSNRPTKLKKFLQTELQPILGSLHRQLCSSMPTFFPPPFFFFFSCKHKKIVHCSWLQHNFHLMCKLPDSPTLEISIIQILHSVLIKH